MIRCHWAVLGIFIAISVPAGASDDIKLPPEVTPALRAACETDVRRLCITADSTVQSVKQCVLAKFLRLGRKCQMEIASAGLAP
jgi:hypothetical protein